MSNAAQPGDPRATYGRESPSVPPQELSADQAERERASQPAVEMQRIESLRIPVGCNLADVERWMIFATLQKCGGNKTRAAALLGVSLKTLYNRLNAYRAQGLTMDYEYAVGGEHRDGREQTRSFGGDEGDEGLGEHIAPRAGARLGDNLRESQ
ncbi:MAG TPA: helix-turn-helix domain-containing protein [Steroidobacter sp.]|nr:helix-turn-helix domain-containing protein [Steroidobacteraceae bacterium]HLS80359.1 helix-turn-helix domain-containing protein [Steroidobacter sp.]